MDSIEGFNISAADWISDTDTVAVMKAIGGDEAEPFSLFVGGCVRDAVLGRPGSDVDIATKLSPQDVMERLTAHQIKAIPTGMDHGTVTAVSGGKPYEITTLRKDIETDGRHAVVSYTDDWLEDAKRRDFTINTLLASMDGRLFDPTGAGLNDLEADRIVFVGEPAERIAEDYLRVLRFFRFHALFGKGTPDPVALTACAAAADHLQTLSKERVTQEVLKILASAQAGETLDLMFAQGLLRGLAGPAYDGKVLARLSDLQTRHEAYDVAARLLVLVGKAEEGADFGGWLLLPNAVKKEMAVLKDMLARADRPDLTHVRRSVYEYGNKPTVQALLLRAAFDDGGLDMDLLDLARVWVAPKFPVNGADLMAAGVPEGPEIGKVIKALEEEWIRSGFEKIPSLK